MFDPTHVIVEQEIAAETAIVIGMAGVAAGLYPGLFIDWAVDATLMFLEAVAPVAAVSVHWYCLSAGERRAGRTVPSMEGEANVGSKNNHH